MNCKVWFLAGIIAVQAIGTVRAGLEQDPLPAATPASADAGVAMRELPEVDPVAELPEIEAQPVRHHQPVGLFTALGKSDGDVFAVMVGADYHFDQHWQLGERGSVHPYGEFLLSYWEGNEGHTGIESLHEAGASVLLRYCYLRHPQADVRPYVDLGLGLHYLTEVAIERKQLGRHWQAGSNVGFGFLFPRSERFEVGVRIRHLSNAGTEDDNWGVNQVLGRVGFRF